MAQTQSNDTISSTAIPTVFDGPIPDEELNVDQELQAQFSTVTVSNDNPLLINPIVRCIFRYLNLSDLKESRKVSKLWNEEAESFITKRSKVIFSSPTNDGLPIPRTPKDFCQKFPEPEKAAKFQSFLFQWANCPISEINNFFETQKRFIKELRIDGILLCSDNGSKIESYDISDWIIDSSITKLRIARSRIHPNLCRRYITLPSLSQLIIHLRLLTSVQDLQLEDHTLEIGHGLKISPEILQIGRMAITRNGEELTECRLSEFFEFKANSEVTCKYSKPTALILDFGENFIAKKIMLFPFAVITNWGISRCTIDTLIIFDIPVIEKNEMKIKHLELRTTPIDLAVLPKELETLRLIVKMKGHMEILCSEPLLLPKLSFVKIDARNSADLAHFANCPNLFEVDIDCLEIEAGDVPLDLNCIPKTVKKLKIFGPIFNIEGHCSVEIFRFHLITPVNVVNCLTQIKTKVSILHLFDTLGSFDSLEIVRVLTIPDDITIYIGPFPSSAHLLQFVDTDSQFYMFQQGIGKSISPKEFYTRLLSNIP